MGLFDFFKKKQLATEFENPENDTSPQNSNFNEELNLDTNNFISKFAKSFNINLTNSLRIIFEPVNGEYFNKLDHGKVISLNIGSLLLASRKILANTENKINSINLGEIDISDLKDLKDLYFVADKTDTERLNYTFEHSPILEKLVFQHHNIKSIDLTKNTHLIELNCSFNELVGLNLNNNFRLQKLDCQFNNINYLNLTENSNLEFLNIRSLPIDGNNILFPKQNKIQELFIDGTKISNIDFSNFVNLQRLQIGNETQNLVINECKFLKSIRLMKSNLEILDISKNDFLTEVFIHESKIGNLTCNELQSFIIPDISKKLNHKPNLEQKDIIKTFELHYKVISYNWDEGLSTLKKILKDPNCDIATATAIFWLGQPNYYLQYQKVSEVPDHSKEQFSFLKNLENRLLNNDFSKKIISFNPKTHANNNWTTESLNLATAKRELDENLKKEIIGQPISHFDISRKYNLNIK
ncbi:DUF4274 domain-containing protein [Lacihabitans sp. CS3-21]|uniref:DUF4274 domain-containing protein n=1 Tax=Lacihabitans sp. CS3-21 TaxID=2487332 RepID=UPI0020CF56D8|nr:DUF4274 domain-containing protein [Lacihabitans sp. CS3-21]MCP9747041.1 DUF4274 domain-containing protein [Lacihabitans sp. CS3-21]